MKVNSGMTCNKLTDSEVDKKHKILRLCNDICSNYEALQVELSQINMMLNMAESYAVSYSEDSFIKAHLNVYKETLKLEVLSNIVEKVEGIKAEAKKEFLQNINFLNILEEFFSKKDRTEIVVFVWKAKKALNYIIYEIDRINNTDNVSKKIAILKGMIADC